MAETNALPPPMTPTYRRAETGEPVLATRYETGIVIGGQTAWLNRWVAALGGVSVAVWDGPDDARRLDIHVTVPGGHVAWRAGQWLVHDLDAGAFAVMDDDTFHREHVTDLVPVGTPEEQNR